MNNVRRKLVAGNWKMNGNSALIESFAKKLTVPETVDVLLCVPAPYLTGAKIIQAEIGSQDCSEFEKGAHTGDVSPSMLVDLGIQYVIVGHSERRQDHNESNDKVALKVQAALNANLTPILCVGEPLDVRESGNVFDYVQGQLDAVIAQCDDRFFKHAIVAYEPIWAIGTGKTATPSQAQEVHAFIRDYLNGHHQEANDIRLLYGGSVNAENAHTLFSQKDIDGGLIGGASLKIDDFNIICQAAG